MKSDGGTSNKIPCECTNALNSSGGVSLIVSVFYKNNTYYMILLYIIYDYEIYQGFSTSDSPEAVAAGAGVFWGGSGPL